MSGSIFSGSGIWQLKTVRDSGKRKNSWRDTGFDRFWRRLAEILARDVELGEKTVFGLEVTESVQTEVQDAGLSWKRSENAGSGTPLPGLIYSLMRGRLWRSKRLGDMSEIQVTYIHTDIRSFKAFKNKDKYIQRMLWKGSLRGWPYVKNPKRKIFKIF